jgi:hypothetical protein
MEVLLGANGAENASSMIKGIKRRNGRIEGTGAARVKTARRAVRGGWASVVLAGALAAVLAGCAGGLTKGSSVEEKSAAVTERSQARWNLIIEREPARAYDYFSKASRQVISRQDFVDRVSRTLFRSAKVEKVDCSAELCKVTVRYTYDHPQIKGVGNVLQETWILEDGVFAYVWPS